MDLKSLLLKKRSPIVKQWCDVVRHSYPDQSQNFLKKKDRFGNPIGYTIAEGIESMYDELLQETRCDKIPLVFENMMKVRAVQDFSPSRAVAFAFGLKKVIRKELGSELLKDGISEEWAAFESKIDGLALLCFDIYTQCRQKIFDIRVHEVKNQSHRLLKMAGLAYDLPENYEHPDYKGDLKDGQVNKGE